MKDLKDLRSFENFVSLTCYFPKTKAALHPPKPEAVFRQLLNLPGNSPVQIFSGCVTPIFSNPKVGKTKFSFMDWIEITDSINPAAPKVCP